MVTSELKLFVLDYRCLFLIVDFTATIAVILAWKVASPRFSKLAASNFYVVWYNPELLCEFIIIHCWNTTERWTFQVLLISRFMLCCHHLLKLWFCKSLPMRDVVSWCCRHYRCTHCVVQQPQRICWSLRLSTNTLQLSEIFAFSVVLLNYFIKLSFKVFS